MVITANGTGLIEMAKFEPPNDDTIEMDTDTECPGTGKKSPDADGDCPVQVFSCVLNYGFEMGVIDGLVSAAEERGGRSGGQRREQTNR